MSHDSLKIFQASRSRTNSTRPVETLPRTINVASSPAVVSLTTARSDFGEITFIAASASSSDFALRLRSRPSER